MNLKNLAWILFTAMLSGCIAPMQRAQVVDGVIYNPSFAVSYEIPEGMTLYSPANAPPEGPLQQMALRIHELNRQYHPAGNEFFYEGFLMFSEQTAFLLATVERTGPLPRDWEWDVESVGSKQLLPLYNMESTRSFPLDDDRLLARLTTGVAYERKGWYYSRSKPGRAMFCYEACTVKGMGRDNYILMGVSFPGHRHILSIQMQEMVRGFRF